MALFQEKKRLHKNFYESLLREKKHSDDILIMNWKGRPEQKWLQENRNHFSKFDCEFDVARAYRTADPATSPILIGYEVKGTHKRANSVKYDPPLMSEGIGQASFMLRQDADYVYIVRPHMRSPVDDSELIETVKMEHFGLTFASQVNGRIQFEEEVQAPLNANTNLDRKKINLAIACMFTKGHGRIQRQEWAREADFLLNNP